MALLFLLGVGPDALAREVETPMAAWASATEVVRLVRMMRARVRQLETVPR